MKKYNKDLIEIILEEEPSLTGFGLNRRCDEDDPIEIDEVLGCVLWLSHQTKQRNINYNTNSYVYKHSVEKWFRQLFGINMYISNGAFIAAVILLGMPYEYDGEVNIFIPLEGD